MDLILDLGNTNKKFALFKNGKLIAQKRYPHFNLDLMREFTQTHPGIERCILSSVIPYSRAICHFLERKFRFLELDEHTPLPIINRYRSKDTLGKDRLASAVAAARRFPSKDILVIIAGTCITYNFINSKSEFLGGSISPGIRMRLEAMHTFTGKLPLLSLKKTGILIGSNTAQSMLSGVLNGVGAEMEGITGRYKEKFPGLIPILSGGDLNYFDKRLKISIFAFPNIVIHGLYQILEFNDPQAS